MSRSPLIKILGALTVLLAVLVGLYFYLQVPHGRTPFLKVIDQAQNITISQGSAQIQLRQEGKQWKVGPAQGPFYAADAEKVKTLVSGLHDVQVEDEIAEAADRGDFDISPASGTQVTLFDAGQKKLADGVFGKQAPDFVHIYFRYPDRPQVYLARNIIRGELIGPWLNDWRDKTLLDLPEAKIQSVMIEAPGFKTSLERSSDTWTLGGKKIDPTPVYTFLGTLAHLKADEFVDSSSATLYSYGNLAWARIIVKTDDRTVELHIGAEDKKGQRFPIATAPDSAPAWLYENHVKPLLLKPSNFKASPAAQKIPLK